MGTIFVDNLEPQSGTSLTLGASGDTVSLTSGAKTSGFGKIGQVLSTVTYTQQATSSTSYSDITSMNLDITLSTTSSKALIMVHVNGAFNNSGVTDTVCRTRVRAVPTSGSEYNIGVLSNYNLRGLGNHGEGTLSACFLDSPSSTVTRNYKVQFSSSNGNQVIVNTNNGSNAILDDNSTNSTLTVMEILD
tara:strand:- start:27 stop:596 length:570 start_codon:yes stop_codon:yes gene_type:complete